MDINDAPLDDDLEKDPATQIIGLALTYEGFGMALDFLSRTEPFGTFELKVAADSIRKQLADGHNLAAIRDGQMIGYAGWLLTTHEQGERWMNDRAILRPLKEIDATAAALTMFASDEASATLRLIRGARELNKGKRVFFKRGYDGTLREAKKSTVLNFSKPSTS